MGSVLSKQKNQNSSLRGLHSTAMKLQLVGALAIFASSAKANFEKIQSVFLQLEEAAYNKTIADDPSQASDRGFVPFIMNYLLDIQYYGCWCYLDETWDQAKGPVQDGLDQECKNLVMNYRCLVMDALDRGETCDPHAQQYTEYNLFGGSEQLVTECNLENKDDENAQCRIDLCISDGEFTLNLFSLMFQAGGIAASQPPYDPTMTHPNNANSPGTFIVGDECKYDYRGAGRSDKECCGTYPARFPFKTFNGDKACCDTQEGGRTYSTLVNQCCAPVPPATDEVVIDINDPCPV